MPSDSSTTLTEDERRIRLRLRDDLEYYCRKCLKIRTKSGALEPFIFNRAQRHLHERLEAQKKRTGRVRAVIDKGRQLGCSTYVAARFFHRATHARGQRVFILTHEQEATDNLFDFVNRFYDHLPILVKPSTGAASAKELVFDKLDSDYKVATAGSKETGRSQTIQLFHGSEVALWPHAATHAAGVMQAIADVEGSESILESTAKGMGNLFHKTWQAAEASQSDYEPVFMPWFWGDDYRRPVPDDFEATDEEVDYAEAYGLDEEQIYWRRKKVEEMRDPQLFQQEYPATAAEAFQNTGHDSFIKPALVVKARHADVTGAGPLILGVDPARFGEDRFSVAWRRGRRIIKVKSRDKVGSTVTGAGWLKQIIDRDKPVRVFIDVGGQGAGVGDLLKDWYGDMIRLIDFGGAPLEPPPSDDERGGGPRNRRAEMWMKSKEWLEEPGGASIPDLDSLQADACGPGYRYDSHSRLVLEDKEHMMKRGVRSPDEWDAVALTFAEPVAPVREIKGVGSAGRGDSAVAY